MAKKGHRNQITLKSTESAFVKMSSKNKLNTPDRLEIKMFDPMLKKHVTFKEKK